MSPSPEPKLCEMPQDKADEELKSFPSPIHPAEPPTLLNRAIASVYLKWFFALLGLIYTLCACLLPSVPGREGDDLPAAEWVPFFYVIAMLAFLYPYFERSSFKKNLDLRLGSLSEKTQDFLERPNYRTIAIAFLLLAVLGTAIGLAFAPETVDGVKNQRPEEIGGDWHHRLRAFSGLIFFISISAAFSTDRRAIAWRAVASCLLIQFLLALFVLRTDLGFNLFKTLADRATVFTNWYLAGATFVFRGDPATYPFALSVVPTIVFYSSFISCLYYCGFMSWVIGCIATAFKKVLGDGITGREATIGVANVFLGQTEAPLLVKPLMSKMSNSEIHCMMTTGFSTIAGSVFGAFLNFGVDGRTLICASVMNAPAGIAISKLFRPETERIRNKLPTHEGEAVIDEMEEIKMMIEESKKESEEVNILHAAGNGAVTGFFLALNVIAVLIAFLALYAFLDSMLGYFFAVVGVPDVSFAMIFGYLFYPVAWLMGVPLADCQTVAKLISKKTFINEFAAYSELSELMKHQFAQQVINPATVTLSKRAEVIAIYALCGFSNVASIGIQIGGLGVLAPSKKKEFAGMGVSAMIAGSIACFMTASIAGMLI